MQKTNAQMQAILDEHETLGPLPIETLTPESARLVPLLDRAAASYYGNHLSKKALVPMPLPVGKVENMAIPGPAGDIMLRVYTPKGNAPSHGWPMLVYYHGGGWVIASTDTYDASCRALCDAASCIVVAAHYRQAPENKWPAAPDDAYAAYLWTSRNAGALDGNPARIAVGGESAGGNLAAVVSLMARDKGGPLPVHQLLVYPVTDIAHGPSSQSAAENMAAKPLNTPMLTWFYNHYMPEGASRTHPYASPLHAEHHGVLPPATIILAEIDPLRSEGEAYARKLEQSASLVNMRIYKGVTHEFFGLKGLVSEAGEAIQFAAEELKEGFLHGLIRPVNLAHARKAA